jgi:hypothetical protein
VFFLRVSLAILLDALYPYRLENCMPEKENISFTMCMPLPESVSRLDGDCLYIGVLSKTLQLREQGASFYCVSLRDRILDEYETPERVKNLVIVNENIAFSELFARIQKKFFEIMSWVFRMHELHSREGSIQKVLDLSAPIIGNHIAISDSAMMLMACTSAIDCDDPISRRLMQYGYHPEETVQQFRKHDLFRLWETADTVYVDDSCAVAKYVTVHKIFRFGNMYFAHVVMSCNNRPLTKGLMDLFQMMLDVLAVYIQREWETRDAMSNVYDGFLTDLLDGSLTDPAQFVGIAGDGCFMLFQFVTTDYAALSVVHISKEFSERFPRMKFTRYQKRLVAVMPFRERDAAFEDLCRELEQFAEKHDALCGVSLPFTGIARIITAYRQSTLALSCADRFRGKKSFLNMDALAPEEPTRLFFFERYYAYLLLESDRAEELWYTSEDHDTQYTLYRHGQRHKSGYLELLSVFLSCERNATQTAAALNMHRNNVTYHIGRIQEMTGLNLDDPSVRFRLLTAFYLLRLFGFRRE